MGEKNAKWLQEEEAKVPDMSRQEKWKHFAEKKGVAETQPTLEEIAKAKFPDKKARPS